MNKEEEILARRVFRELEEVLDKSKIALNLSIHNLDNITGDKLSFAEDSMEEKDGLLNEILTITLKIKGNLDETIECEKRLNRETKFWKTTEDEETIKAEPKTKGKRTITIS